MRNNVNNFNDVIENMAEALKSLNNSSRDAYYQACEFIDDLEEIGNSIADNLNDIADDIEDLTNHFFYNDYYDYNNDNNNAQSDNRKNNNTENNNYQSQSEKCSEKQSETDNKKSSESVVTAAVINNIDVEKFKSLLIECIYKCKAKLSEINFLIKDFCYADKKSYEDSCTELEEKLTDDFNNIDSIKNHEEFILSFNKMIDYINALYKNAYYKKHNKSTLLLVIEDAEDEEELNPISHINL